MLIKKVKAPFPPECPKQYPCGHKHISWSTDDDHIFYWDCNRKYPLVTCFRPAESNLTEPRNQLKEKELEK